MKATYVQKGENINYKNPTEDKITLGTLIIIGAICAVAVQPLRYLFLIRFVPMI